THPPKHRRKCQRKRQPLHRRPLRPPVRSRPCSRKKCVYLTPWPLSASREGETNSMIGPLTPPTGWKGAGGEVKSLLVRRDRNAGNVESERAKVSGDASRAWFCQPGRRTARHDAHLCRGCAGHRLPGGADRQVGGLQGQTVAETDPGHCQRRESRQREEDGRICRGAD